MATPESDATQSEKLPPKASVTDDTLGETQFLASDTSSRSPSRAGATSTNAESWVGRQIGRYEIRGVLGTGGMGVVYRAFDTLIEREVAVKVLSEQVSEDSQALQRFLAEAKAAGKLNHPNTVAIYEIAKEGDDYYLVMELVIGGSIAERMERVGALSVLEATRVTADACRGLAAAHAVGLVHRDIKPANLLCATTPRSRSPTSAWPSNRSKSRAK